MDNNSSNNQYNDLANQYNVNDKKNAEELEKKLKIIEFQLDKDLTELNKTILEIAANKRIQESLCETITKTLKELEEIINLIK